MHTICSPYGQVLRIVIFKKNGVQTMVEYPFAMSETSILSPQLYWQHFTPLLFYSPKTPPL